MAMISHEELRIILYICHRRQQHLSVSGNKIWPPCPLPKPHCSVCLSGGVVNTQDLVITRNICQLQKREAMYFQTST